MKKQAKPQDLFCADEFSAVHCPLFPDSGKSISHEDRLVFTEKPQKDTSGYADFS